MVRVADRGSSPLNVRRASDSIRAVLRASIEKGLYEDILLRIRVDGRIIEILLGRCWRTSGLYDQTDGKNQQSLA